jgi:hypothetical protein
VRKFLCSHCHGSGTRENITLPGIVPLLDRPSAVDDDAWDATEKTEVAEIVVRDEKDDKTVVRTVPTFRMPPRPRPPRPLPRSAAPCVAPFREGDTGSAMVHTLTPVKGAAAPAPKKRRRWPVAVLSLAMLVALALAVVSTTRGKSWLPRLERAVSARLIASARALGR